MNVSMNVLINVLMTVLMTVLMREGEICIDEEQGDYFFSVRPPGLRGGFC